MTVKVVMNITWPHAKAPTTDRPGKHIKIVPGHGHMLVLVITKVLSTHEAALLSDG